MSEAILTRKAKAVPARAPFVFVIFLGSFLLFLIQPMFGRMILPRLGGAPAVWNTAMLFFQAMLLAGYLYAHAIARWPLKRQLATHLALFVLAAATLPIGLAGFYPASGGVAPALWLIGLLFVSIGPVFFVVAAQAPLMQAWFARSGDPAAHSPYFLYAASNAGSLLALLAYPLLVEPLLPLAYQSWFWSGGFAALAITVAGAGLLVAQSGAAAGEAAVPAAAEPASWRLRLNWALLAAVPSGLLLSTTTHITTDVMAMPLLWVIPLALYLATFIIAFAAGAEPLRRGAAALAPYVVYGLGARVMVGGESRLGGFAWHLVLFFTAALGLHIALARRQPPAAQLTEFYLWMSIGGVIGGLFCALAAPIAFDWTYEHLVLIVAAAALLPAPLVPALVARVWERWDGVLRIAVPILFAGLALLALLGGTTQVRLLGLLFQLLFLAGFLVVGRRGLTAFCLAMLMLAAGGWANLRVSLEPGARERSFFGVSTILDRADGRVRSLVHGTTIHGMQSLEPGRETEPLAYYAEGSGIAAIMRAAPGFAGPQARIGLVGLGAGSLVCFSSPGQSWIAYEIDPVVIRIARDSGRFSFISRCRPDLGIVEGDARLTLAAERPGRFDLLVVDAFSSDAIPLHLLTREAFDVYARTLERRGVIAMNITNRYLDVEPVIAAIAAERGWSGRIRHYLPDAAAQARDATESRWLVLAPDEARLAEVMRAAGARGGDWAPLTRRPGFPAWTDDFSSVLPLLSLR
jgi:spermidine synthase